MSAHDESRGLQLTEEADQWADYLMKAPSKIRNLIWHWLFLKSNVNASDLEKIISKIHRINKERACKAGSYNNSKGL